MSLRKVFSFPVLMLALAIPVTAAPAMAGAQFQSSTQSRPVVYAACLAEAKWPLTHTPAYRNGAIRDRQVLANSYVPAVESGKAMCMRANRVTPAMADGDCDPASDAAVSDHARRLGALCRALIALRH